ncbi:MAG: DNA polymerase I [Planctomycetes bacterium]|nr:DNA polymerase I [Planctomycetota bacterium]
MQLVTWNVNSLKAREEFVVDYLDETQPDIICLQELKQEEDSVPKELFEERGYQLAIHGQRQWNGVLIASKKPISNVVKGLPDGDEGQSRLIACQIEDLKLVNLYCPQGQAEDSPKFQYKLRFFKALRKWIADTYSPDDNLLIVGDLNIAPLKTDVWDIGEFKNVPTYHPLEHKEWKELLSFGLEDVVHPYIEPGQFTFWDYRGASFRENKGMRIDHMLATKSVGTWVTGASIDREARKKRKGNAPSDHAPVSVTLDPKAKEKPASRKGTKLRVILIDGSSLIYRAYYAIPGNLTASSGLHTNAIYGFALMFGKILAGKLPDFGAMIFDAPGPTFRNEEYPDYKAHRPSMPPDLKEQLASIDRLVEQHDFPILRVEGYEADDVIGTLTRQAIEAGHEVRIVSGDKDFAQLIGPDVRMIDTLRDIVFDTELVRKRWGVSPEIFIDHLALLGDSADNIPGVPGIGQKGSASLLERFGSLDGIYENIEELKGKQKANLIEFRDQAYMSRRLATIDTNVPLDVGLDDLKFNEPNPEKINQVYREFEFYSLLSDEEQPESAEMDSPSHIVCTDVDAFNDFIEANSTQLMAVTPAFEQPSHLTGALVGAAVATSDGAAYIPLGTSDGSLGKAGLKALKTFLEDESKPKVVHNLRDVWCLFSRHGIELNGVTGDLTLASFLIDPAKLLPHRIDQIVKEYLHRTVEPLKRLTGSGKSEKKLVELKLDELSAWACQIAAAAAQAWPKVSGRLNEEGQAGLLAEVSMPMALVLAEMQLCGIRVDKDDLEKMGEEFSERKAEVESTIYEMAGSTFNIGSTKQLAIVLFEDLGLPVIKKTKTGYSTAADVLERLAAKHEIAKLILRQRALAKLINTYTSVLKNAVSPEDGRVHCTFQQTSGVSGRLITTDPDLQRTPIRSEDGKRIRQAFLPKATWTLISADWSQIELRILAHFSKDPRLISAFRDEIDLHRVTAAELFDVSESDVTSEQRNVGKTVNFATIYGQGATALGQQLGLSRNEAKEMIDRYFKLYAGVRSWLDDTIAAAHESGFVSTILGRKRYIPELSSNNFSDRAYGERIAANTPIQGSAADICKLAMLEINRRFKVSGVEAKMVLQIHDELLFEAPKNEVADVTKVVRECMERPYDLDVPLKVDIGTGTSWAKAH